MRIASLLTVFLTVFFGHLSAQRTCAAEEILHQQLLNNPALQQQLDEIERHTHDFIQSNGGAQERIVVTIPVVVNVIWNTTAENISEAQINSQIAILNADFRRLNADAVNTPSVFQGIAADCEINFCLATRDPNGNATNGIRRQQTAVTAFSANDAMKFTAQGGLDAWSRDQYLNIWVCDLSGGLLGYAQFPGGPAATDGVVVDYQYFGNIGTATAPFNLGRTGTHEVGHWLNLRHIWGDDGTSCTGSDQVADTPNQADEHYGCPTFPQVSCNNGPNGDMFMNYMDYTDDACMNVFTAGQKARMQALFAAGGARVSLLSSLGCQPPSGGGSCATPAGLNATNVAQTTATVNWGAVSGAASYNLQYKLSSSSTWITITGITTTSRNLTGLTAGSTYNYQVQAVCSGSSSTYSAAANFTTQSSSSCTDTYEANNTLNTSKVIPVGTTITALIGSSTDLDHFQFSNTSAQRNIKVDLFNLPLDYDLRLYRGNTLLASSLNAGTTPEQIRFNTTTVSSTYRARVFGYNGAFSTTQCYNLTVALSATAWRTDGSTDGEVTEMEIPVQFESLGFGMYPNPATDQLTIEVEMTEDADVQVAVMDAAGRIAISEHREMMGKANNQIQLDLSRLQNGIYMVQVRNGETVNTRKLVVQK